MAAQENGVITLVIRRTNFEEIQENFNITNISNIDELFQRLGSLAFVEDEVNVTQIWSWDAYYERFTSGINVNGWVAFGDIYRMRRLHVQNWNWSSSNCSTSLSCDTVEHDNQDENEEHIIDMDIDEEHPEDEIDEGMIEEIGDDDDAYFAHYDDDDDERSQVSNLVIREVSLLLHYSGVDDNGDRFFSTWPSNFEDLVIAFWEADMVMATFIS
ncbi:hypothetical protein LIER_20334 [Lithospermum erythrorhizon]|uniref:Uncharacterized protein n=1 Tax=Lithospermum erythrorhizon TaxID=34254 RepID=A0AAV3QL32_LITER